MVKDMESNLFFAFVLCYVYLVSGYDIFEGFLQQGKPCFDVVEVPKECNTHLSESFKPTFEKLGTNEPTTSAYLFTPDNPDEAEPLHECGGRLPSGSTYDPDANTEIFIHGWLDGVCRTAWMRECKEQLFQRGRFNVIFIDWTWGNSDILLGSSNCRIVGQQVGFIIGNIMEQTGVSLEKFHMIGHSFGSIISGFTGRYVQQVFGKSIRRITALDPPFAPYGDAPPEERVTYRDARIVDVIHSNAYHCFAVANGDERVMGHADFYPNGGTFQMSCYTYAFEAFLKGDFLYAIGSLDPRLCSHLQAIQYYKVSINNGGCQYVGLPFESIENIKQNNSCGNNKSGWAVMGMDYELYHKSEDIEQKYCLKTSLFCPYYDDSYLGRMKFPFKTSCT